ncbi:MAG: methyltransferase domain-containing protein [Clostridium sp.]
MYSRLEKSSYSIKNRIKSLLNEGELERAELILNNLINNMNNDDIDIELYSLVSILFYLKGELDKAEEAAKYGLKIDSDNFELIYNLSEIYLAQEKDDLALTYYRKAYNLCNNINLKENIKSKVEEICNKNNYMTDTKIFLNDIKMYGEKILLICNFYSVYMEQYIEELGNKLDIKFDILTVDDEYNNERNNISRFINKVYIYKTKEEFENILDNMEYYDFIHIHYLHSFYGEFYEKIKIASNKIIITIWGSDFYKANEQEKIRLKNLISISDKITFDNEVTMDEFCNYYKNTRKKSRVCRFGLKVLEYIDKLEELDKETIKSKLGVPANSIIVTCGYNADIYQQHLSIIESIKNTIKLISQDVYFIFPMTYKIDEIYLKSIKARLEVSGLNYKVIDEFMNYEEIAMLEKATDIFIQVQTSDTLSATMIENLYCKNIVITGSWLPYQPLKENGIEFIEVDMVDQVGDKLIWTIENMQKLQPNYDYNNKIISNMCLWKHTASDWKELYTVHNSLKKVKILIVAYFFPPVGGAGVQRTLKFVKYLRDFGYEPIVLTCNNSKYGIEDESLLAEIPDDIEIIRIDDIADDELNDEFINKMIEYYLDLVDDEQLKREFINSLNSSYENLKRNIFTPDNYIAWAAKVISSIDQVINFNSIDMIYTTSSPYSDHIIGYHIKRKYRKPWVVDFRDEWTNNPYVEFDHNDIRFKVEQVMEKTILEFCDHVLVVTESSESNYKEIFSVDENKISTITNGYDESDFIFEQDDISKKNEFSIIHNGFIYGDRTIEYMARAIRNLIDSNKIEENRIKVYFTRADNNGALKYIINKYNLEKNFILLGYVEHKDSLKLCSSMECLLLLVGSGEKVKSVYTGKVFEYLRLNKPIISLSPENSIVDKLIKSTGRGINCEMNDTQAIEAAILQYYKLWENKNQIEFENSSIMEFDRKMLTLKLSNLFNNIIYNFKSNSRATLEKIVDSIRKKEFNRTIQLCDMNAKAFGESGNVLYYKAVAYNSIREFDKSYYYHKRALQISPKLADIKEGISKLKENYDEMDTVCLGCGGHSYEVVWVGNQSALYNNYEIVNPIRRWVKCNNCGLVYANPIPTIESYNKLSEKLAEIEISNGFYKLDDYFEFNVEVANIRMANIEKYTSRKGRLLDIGAGYGTFIGVARDRGWNITGLEFSKNNYVYAKKNYDIELLNKNFYDFDEDDKYDVITLFEVIEHLWSPKEDLKKINSLLNVGGILVIATPNLTSLFCRKYKEFNMFWYMHCHLTFFSREVLALYLEECGFEILEFNISKEGKGRMEIYAKKISE